VNRPRGGSQGWVSKTLGKGKTDDVPPPRGVRRGQPEKTFSTGFEENVCSKPDGKQANWKKRKKFGGGGD